jgi:hypothetical protein
MKHYRNNNNLKQIIVLQVTVKYSHIAPMICVWFSYIHQRADGPL